MLVALGVTALALAAASPALATPPDTISSSAPSPITVNADAATAVPGASVTDVTDAQATLLVSVSTTLGSLSLSNTTGLTLSYGYSAFAGSSFSFTATTAGANAALATLALTGTGTPGAATISISATENETGIAYLASNQHYYEFVPNTSLNWTGAQTAANQTSFDGQEGYLATVPDQSIKDFVDAHLDGAENVWAGGMATDYPLADGPDGSYRAWRWAGQTDSATVDYGGPLAGTVFTECGGIVGDCTFSPTTNAFFRGTWNGQSGAQEPNNSGYSASTPNSGEHYLEINYNAHPGTWNDLRDTNTGQVAGYVIEFGDDSIGASAWDGQSTATGTVTTAHAPAAPTDVVVSGTATPGGQATVSWSVPADDGGSPISGYQASATATDGAPAGGCATTTQTSCVLTGLASGSLYRLRCRRAI